MITVWQVISNVESLIRAVNSDADFNAAQCKFILDYCVARVISQNRVNARSDGRRTPQPLLDYSLYQRKSLSIEDGSPPFATLPFTPFAIPDQYGIRSVQIYDPNKGSLVNVKLTTYEEASFLTNNAWMPQWQDPVAVRMGEKLEFFALPRSIDEVQVVMLGNQELPVDENGDPDWEAEYRIPPDYLNDVTEMAVNILLRKMQVGEDNVNDGVENNRIRS